jgi:hypothetical protein
LATTPGYSAPELLGLLSAADDLVSEDALSDTVEVELVVSGLDVLFVELPFEPEEPFPELPPPYPSAYQPPPFRAKLVRETMRSSPSCLQEGQLSSGSSTIRCCVSKL